MTWSCARCGKVFLSEYARDRHEGECGLNYKPGKCVYCDGKGRDVYRRKCPYCGGSGARRS